MSDTIYIVVPVFNRKALTKRFLHCLRQQSFTRFTVIVVDDGSSDGTAEMITEQFKEVHLLRGDGNLWWTGAINVGIRHALQTASEDDSILVINDDVELSLDYLQMLHGARTLMQKTLIGSVVVDIATPDVILDGGRTVNWWTAKLTMLNLRRPLSDFPPDYHLDVAMLTGWGTLIPVEVFRHVGLYDDEHFQQCGDTELTVRAKNAGYRLVVCYSAVLQVHNDETDNVNVSNHYSFRDLWRYFFDVKSNFRLKYRWFFSIKSIANPFALVSFLFFDFCRITVHFLLRVRFRSIQASATSPTTGA